jgi:hypothetical protein
MIQFDTFIFDYDTKNAILFSGGIVLLRIRQAWLLTEKCLRRASLNSTFFALRTKFIESTKS